MEKTIEKKIRYHHLYDIYGVLLTEKQKTAFEYYYMDDYSLSEIASLLDVSRNAVYEQINIATNYLEEYENKLGLLEKSQNMKTLLEQYRLSAKNTKEVLDLIQEIEKLE